MSRAIICYYLFVKKIIIKTRELIFQQQEGIFSSAIILSLMIVVSRIFGFLRYRILAGYFPKGELDIYFASFRIPDLVFEIIITGAFTSSFIPIFIRYQKNKDDLNQNISSIFNLLTIFLIFFIVIIFFLLKDIIPLITPGFDNEKINRVIFFSQLLLVLQLPFLVLGNYLTGIAQASKAFFVTAVAPVIYNLAIIIVTFLFAQKYSLLAPILGVVVGSIFFLIVQLPILFSFNYSYLFVIKITDGVKDFFKMVVPRVMTVLFTQIDATIDLTLTSLLGSGSYTVFYLAQHLHLLPVSVIGIAYGQASLPYISELYEEKKTQELKEVIVSSVLNLFFLTFPIMGFFIFARTPIVRLFFGGEKFDWDATVNTALALSYFSLSIPFHSIYYFITRCFYALMDTKTPFFISLISIGINTILSIFFVIFFKFPVWSLAISFSISVICNVLILSLLLIKKINGIDIQRLFKETLKILIVTSVSCFTSYSLLRLLDGLIFDTSRTINVFFLLFTVGLSYFLIYLFLSWIIDIKEFYLISKLLLKMKEYQKKLVEIYTTYE